MKIECASTITSVVVHGRGALVTRAVALPDDLPVDVEVDVANVTLFAEAGSVRAALAGSERAVAAIRSSVVVPGGEIAPGPTLAKVRELIVRSERLGVELDSLRQRRLRIAKTELAAVVRTQDGKRPRHALDARFGDALTMTALLRDKVAGLDERILGLEGERRETDRALEAARLEDRQTSLPARVTHPSRTLTTRLVGSGTPGQLLVTYAVMAARWWPVYTLRIGKDRAAWAFEAIVAQETGEDWAAVTLALSSADLVFDARLPELPSLRFGRAQPRRPTFRNPPVGVDEMFDAYVIFGRKTFTAPAPAPTSGSIPSAPAWSEGEDASEGEDTSAMGPMKEMMKKRAVAPMMARRAGPPTPPAPAPMMSMLQSAPMPPGSAAELFGSRGGASGIGAAPARGAAAPIEADAASIHESRDEEEEPLSPSDTWLDYDGLVLASPDDTRHRGRLIPNRSDAVGGIARTSGAVDRVAEPGFRDPRTSRGMFDQRYESEGSADVPSDGRAHRVTVGTAETNVRLAWRTVPVASPEVFREAILQNPFGYALLGGPVDVYLDGSLLTTTSIDRIDRGGRLTVGMGVDERIKVARNVRVAEEASGLLGGALTVTHNVDIELSSTIGGQADVTVLERVPVTDDKAIEVKIVRVTPPADPYDQAGLGAPIRGGLAFHVTVDPAKKSRLEVVYRLQYANKLDIAGGSRRG